MDTSLSLGLIQHTLLKVRHYVYISVLTGLAVLATGTSRLRLAFLLTMGVGVAWEVAQTTVVGRNARLADVAPNIVAGLACVALIKVAAIATRQLHGRKEAQAAGRRPTA